MELCKKARVWKIVFSLVMIVLFAVNVFLTVHSYPVTGDLEDRLEQGCRQVESLELEISRNGREPQPFIYDLFCNIKRGDR